MSICQHVCGACGKKIDEKAASKGAVVTREGAKHACSGDCFMKLLESPETCTIGEFEKAQKAGLN